MNLFILSLFQKEIAEFMMDIHISKIILEAVQMLCTAKIMVDPEDEENDKLYKIAHKNHPVSKWVRESQENYIWVLDLVEELHKEWRFRFKHNETKYHKSYLVSLHLRKNTPPIEKFEKIGLTPFALAMPDKYKCEDAIEAYRNYYMSPEKQSIAFWKNGRERPVWYVVEKRPTIPLTEYFLRKKPEQKEK